MNYLYFLLAIDTLCLLLFVSILKCDERKRARNASDHMAMGDAKRTTTRSLRLHTYYPHTSGFNYEHLHGAIYRCDDHYDCPICGGRQRPADDPMGRE
jgi:hypothetical protein